MNISYKLYSNGSKTSHPTKINCEDFNKLPHLQKMTSLTCDYLVVGGGAAGMAFVDELIHHSKDLTVVMVDRCLEETFYQ